MQITNSKALPLQLGVALLEEEYAIPTIEEILSRIRTLKSLAGTEGVDGFSDEILGKLDLAICERVREIVQRAAPNKQYAVPYFGKLDTGDRPRKAG